MKFAIAVLKNKVINQQIAQMYQQSTKCEKIISNMTLLLSKNMVLYRKKSKHTPKASEI